MPAISYVYTIANIAQQLGEDIDWLWDVCAEMEPEDGCLWVYGPDQDQTIAFTPFGLENLNELIKLYKANPDALHRSA